MLIGNNRERRRRRKTFFAWSSSGSSVTSASIIIVLTLLAGSFVLINPMPMIATTAFAQEEENNTTITAGATSTATTTSDTTTATTSTPSSLGLELSPQPIWEEEASNTGVNPINETHTLIEFIGNGTLTVPDTGETIPMINNGTALVSSVTGSAYGRENVFSEDGDTTAITFYEIVQGDPETLETRGVIIAVFDRNGTGSLALFNGMITVGIHDEQPNAEAATTTLWEWESGIGRDAGVGAPPPVQGESTMNITTTTNATAADTNATAADEEGGGGGEQTTIIPALLRE